MTFHTRWSLPVMLSVGLFMACGSSGGAGPAARDDAGMTGVDGATGQDVRVDSAPVDRPPPFNACASPPDISARMPGADGAIHVMANNSEMRSVRQIGDLAPCKLQSGIKVNAVVFRYTMRTAGHLLVSTDNKGTASAFDTILAVLPTCTFTATALACNDDAVGHGNLHSETITGALMLGQTVFIVVGGYGESTPGSSAEPFELTVREVASVSAGGACSATMPCADTAECVVNPGSTTTGTCVADGIQTGRCRLMAPACDMGLACSISMPSRSDRGVCRRVVAAGMDCSMAGTVCAMGSTCRSNPTDATQRICIADGASGGACRASTPRCDGMGAECSAGHTCVVPVAMGGACDVTGGGTSCATGASCAPNAMGTVGTCATNGSAAGTACRDVAKRCDATLECSTMTGAGTCFTPIAAGMPCVTTSNNTRCGMGGSCDVTTLMGTTGICIVPTDEVEPNDTPARGNGRITTNAIFRASLSTGADVDCVRVTVPANASITAFTSDEMGTCTLSMGADTVLKLYNPMGMQIAENDDGMDRKFCSEINATTMGASHLAAGTYAVCVEAFRGANAIAAYSLHVRIVPGM